MSDIAQVVMDSSQFPENVRRDLLDSLRTRRVNHKFLYDSPRQTRKWLALHEVLSPSRNDPDCAAAYDRSFASAADRIGAARVHLIGLGCGGGQKDTSLLELFCQRGKDVSYSPCDVSTAMVLVARQAALGVITAQNCFPAVCDLATADDLPALFAAHGPPHAVRLVTFFGMIPNFEPQSILPKLESLIRPEDFLLFSANLAPGGDYAEGLRRVLPQYDNDLTRDWLMSFLFDLGVEAGDGEMRFTVEDGSAGGGLKKIVARFHFARSRRIETDGEAVEFRSGDDLQLFFSYRYTPALVRAVLGSGGFDVLDQWITKSEEEGVFLCTRR